MNEIKIKCPTCGKVLRLKDVPNINAAFFTCPVCKEKHIVGKCQRYVEQPKPIASSGDEKLVFCSGEGNVEQHHFLVTLAFFQHFTEDFPWK